MLKCRRQPGTLFTQWQSVRFAGRSALGLLCLVAAVVSLLYTTAAGALGKSLRTTKTEPCTYPSPVQPQLRSPPWRNQLLRGDVQTSLGNLTDLQQGCLRDWPEIRANPDLEDRPPCGSFKLIFSCGNNFNNYLSAWGPAAMARNPDLTLSGFGQRPRISAHLDGNITVMTQWLDVGNIEQTSERLGRIGEDASFAAFEHELTHVQPTTSRSQFHTGVYRPQHAILGTRCFSLR